MRELIRKWLGINEIQDYDIKSHVNEVLGDMITDGTMASRYGNHRQKFDELVQTQIDKRIGQNIHNQVKDYVKDERFIDDIVTRIKNKQL